MRVVQIEPLLLLLLLLLSDRPQLLIGRPWLLIRLLSVRRQLLSDRLQLLIGRPWLLIRLLSVRRRLLSRAGCCWSCCCRGSSLS